MPRRYCLFLSGTKDANISSSAVWLFLEMYALSGMVQHVSTSLETHYKHPKASDVFLQFVRNAGPFINNDKFSVHHSQLTLAHLQMHKPINATGDWGDLKRGGILRP